MASKSTRPKAGASKPADDHAAKGDLKALPVSEVEKRLGTSPDGLTQAEAEKRLTQYGPNEIDEHKVPRERPREAGRISDPRSREEHEPIRPRIPSRRASGIALRAARPRSKHHVARPHSVMRPAFPSLSPNPPMTL